MKKKTIFLSIIIVIAILSLGNDCDHGLKPRLTAIEGVVIFVGEWPEEAIACYLGIVKVKLEELELNLDTLEGVYEFPQQVITEKWDSVHFWMEIPSGEYSWIFVGIFDEMIFADPPDYGWRNLAGEYRDPEDTSQLGTAVVARDQTPYVRIVVDFTTPYVGVGNDPWKYFHLKSDTTGRR